MAGPDPNAKARGDGAVVLHPERRANPRSHRLVVSDADSDASIGADTGRCAEAADAGRGTDAESCGNPDRMYANPNPDANSAMRRTGCSSRSAGRAMSAGGTVPAGTSVATGTESERRRCRTERGQAGNHQAYACWAGEIFKRIMLYH